MADYNLGRAHGRIVVDYDKKGTDTAQEEFAAVEEAAQSLEGVFEKLRKFFNFFSTDFVASAQRMAASLGLLSGGAAILLGISRATGNLNGSLFKLRGGLAILGSLGILLGGVPKSVQNFPNVIKRIILLSAAITLFARSSRLLDAVVKQFGKFLGSTKIIRTLTSAFPGLTGMLSKLAGFIPSIRQVGAAVDGLGKPVHQIARLALGIGSLISLFRTGTKMAVGLAKAVLKIGAGAMVIQGLIFLVSGLIDAIGELAGALGIIPALFTTAGIAAATLKVGFQGVDEALKNLNGTQEEFNESIKGLAPSAKESMRALRGFRDEWRLLRMNVQQQLFKGMSDEINSLGNIYMPLLRVQLGLVAVELNKMAKEVAAFGKRGDTIAGVNRLFEMTRAILNNLSRAIQPLLQAFLDIAIVSSEVLSDLTMGAGEAAQSFADFIRHARETGDLYVWIQRGITAVARLVDIVWTLGEIFNTIFDAFDTGGDGFLLTVNKMLDGWSRFLQSVEGQEALNTIVELLETFSGATRAVLAAGLSELGPILKELMPFLKEMAETFSTVLVAAIKILGPLIRGLAEALSFIAPVLGPILGFFLAWSVLMGALGIGISLLFGIIGTLVTAIGSVITVLRILGTVLMANPIIAIIGLIALAAWLIIDNWEKVQPVLAGIWNWISSTAKSVADFFVGVWTTVRDFFVDLWNDVYGFVKSVFTDIANFFVNIWTDVTDFFINLWDDVSGAVVDIWNWIVDTFRFIWEPIGSILGSIISIIRDLLIIVFGGIAIIFIEIWNSAKAAFIEAWNRIKTAAIAVWTAILIAFHAIWDPIAEFFTTLWNAVTEALVIAWEIITQKLQAAWDAIMVAFHAVWDPVAEFFTVLWETITTATTDAWNVLVGWLQQKWEAVKNFLTGIWNGIASFFKKIWNSDIVTAFRNGVNNAIEWVQGLPGRILNFVKDAGRWLLNAGKAVIQGFLNGLKEAFKAVADWVGGIADWISAHKGPLDYDRRLLIPAGQAIMEGLLGGLQSKEDTIKSFLQGLTSDIQGGLDGATDMLNNSATTLASSATVGIVTSFPSNEKAVASSPTPIGTGAKAIPGSARAGDSAAPATILVDKLDLHITGNLDPTNPVAWRQAIVSIKDGIRSVDRDYPNE
jgi:phage-related protein